MAQRQIENIVFRRVKAASGGITIGNSTIGITVRYLVGKGRCEINVRYWLRLKLHGKTITISASTGLLGCEDGIAAALALAEKFEASEIELCDPNGHVSDALIEDVKQKMVVERAG